MLKHTNDFKELSRLIEEYVQPQDTVLLKGSRSMELERLVPELEKKFNTQQGNS